jgi:hypothetical protein
MTCGWSRTAAVLGCSLGVLAGAGRLAAQGVRELGLQAKVTASDPVLAVGGLYGAVRLSPRVRAAATAGLGASGGQLAGRGELLAHFLFHPGGAARTGLYVGGGVAGVAGVQDEGYVVLLLGLESRPGGRSGWALEAGVGGGVRLTAGYRWRRFSRRDRGR